MSKKQIKLSPEQLLANPAQFTLLNFILKNGSVFLAKPILLKSDLLKVKNTKGHILDLPLTQIAEIWAEEKVS